jgi:outer membrane receptor for ferrienterochelin and colicins
MSPTRALLATCLSLSVLAFAEDSRPPGADSGASAKKLEKIEVRAPDEADERRTSTGAKIVVSRDELVRYGDTSLLDALKRLPGITVEGTAGRGGTIRMRGLGTGYTQILVDGDSMPPGFSIESISPDLIDRIEIYRSASAEFSTQAIAGTINIVLKGPVSQRRRELKAGASAMHGDVSSNASAQVSDRIGRLAYTLPFNVNTFRFHSSSVAEQRAWDADGIANLDYVTLSPSRGDGGNLGFSPKLAWTLGPEETVTWESFANIGRQHVGFDDRSTTFLGSPPAVSSAVQRLGSDFQTARTSLNWARLANDAPLDLKGSLSYNHRKSHAVIDAYDVSDAYLYRRTIDGNFSDDSVAVKGKYTFPLFEGHAFVSGWDTEYARRTEERAQVDLAPSGTTLVSTDESYAAHVGRLALYVQDEWQATKRLSVYFGLRWEGIDTRSAGNTFSEVTNRSSVWSPVLQALWKLPGTDKDQLRASLARTWKVPSTFELMPRRYIMENNTATTPNFQGNPGLKPELAWGLDAAYEHYFAAGGVFSVSTYARRIEDVILRELIQLNGLFVARPANVGTASVKGVELDAKFPLAALWAGAPAVDVRANVSRNWSHVDYLPGPYNRLAQQNRFNGNVGFDYKAGAQLTVGANLNVVTGGPIRLSTTQSSYSMARRNLEAYALWKISPAMQVRVFGNNLLAQDNLRIDYYNDTSESLQLTSISPTYRTFGFSFEAKY